jgi:DNA-binding CsgD family transcriptional regulator
MQLSPRQREILDLVAEGRTSKEIAVALGISESTVNWHLANAFERLGASSRAEAVALAMRSNGADQAPRTPAPASAPAPARVAWPRLVAIAIAIAIAGALLGGAAVATLRLRPLAPPTASPANTSGAPTSSPAGGSGQDVIGGETVPIEGGLDAGPDPTAGLLPGSGATLLPSVSAPPLPSVPLPVSTSALPSVPVTPPPLPSLPLPSPIPTPHLPLR